MIEGVFGRIEGGSVVGWAYDTKSSEPVSIVVKQKNKELASGLADVERHDLIDQAVNQKGRVGYKIKLPQGRKNWSKIEVFANKTKLDKSAHLTMAIEKSRRTLKLEINDPYFFIHIPKTAGTAYRLLLESAFEKSDFFPSEKIIKERGLYPLFHDIIKYDKPTITPKILIGHYPYALHQVVKGEVKRIVIFRDPVARVISNIYHMKNNDPRWKDKTPEEIYQKGKWHYQNLQVRYMVDKVIHPNMKYINSMPLGKLDLKAAIANMRSCDMVGVSEKLSESVNLTNKMFNWSLAVPKKVNVAKSKKTVSEKLIAKITKDNLYDQKLYEQAIVRFQRLCEKYEIVS